ncbi:hypothetical protein [Pseudomonas sp. NFPP28]|uniref:hypothetical protein n=1 Tax=Pseudomonas sp. NFPP28 TaxID=1566231 RepID=UPI0008E7282A|nr:hypothetical protein [Pseudomonas sp. NFPP28]SFP28393.1 hypothetical protein SAMN03159315_02613 [Pseudomonas sp. NFPP28]
MDIGDLPSVWTVQIWETFFRDEAALLRNPSSHHKVLVKQAYALNRLQLIDGEGLSDLLERADGALEYAVEAFLDESGNQ